MKKSTIAAVLLFFSVGLSSQTVVTDTSYTTTVLECVSDYVDFSDVVRYFSGLVVKQGTRLYYLDRPYNIEVLGERIIFDDPDKYTERVTVYLNRTYYADMAEFKAAAASCLLSGGVDTVYVSDTTYLVDSPIDSISYYGDTLYVYAGGNPIPFTTYIDSCPCETTPPSNCVYVLGNPETGEVWGEPATGQVWFMMDCPPVSMAYAIGEPSTGEVWGEPGTGQVFGWTN